MTGPWYEEGLRFACTGCGRCCTVPGYVWVDRPQIERLAAHLELAEEAFARRFLRRVGRRLSLVEKANGECVFWEHGRGCTVYPARPVQCRTFPFWKEHLASREAWQQVAALSPGVDDGRLYERAEIDRLAAGEGETAAARAATPPPVRRRGRSGS